ncbi:MAG: Fe2+-dependent dioxygenase [Formosimonas sp.]
MLVHIPQVLTPDELQLCRRTIESATWVDGAITAGTQSGQVKNNRQLPEDAPEAIRARAVILAALQRNALFFSATLPKKIYPPLFNRYDGATNSFGNHIDNAIRGQAHPDWVRTDVSMTLFLSAPEEYDGGELVMDELLGEQRIKLPAGDMIVYPSSSVHRVEPVTRGSRLCMFTWLESLVRSTEQRRLLFDIDVSLAGLRSETQDSADVVRLTGCYHNLLRMWADS